MYSDAEMEAARSELEIVTAERDALRKVAHDNATARDAYLNGMNEARKDAAHWRGEAECWQARYEGMEAALRVALEVCK